jgi:hypothetical protein
LASPPQFRVIPTGAGEPRAINTKIDHAQPIGFTSDDKHILINGVNAEGKKQTFETDFDGTNQRAHTPAGTVVVYVTTSTEIRQTPEGFQLWHLATGTAEPIQAPKPNERLVGASDDLATLYVAERNGKQVKLWRVDRRSGVRTFMTEILPHDSTGVMGVNNIGVSADGKTIVYGYTREVSELYLARPAK